MSLKERAAIEVEGTVQGVGFRPFVYRLAIRFGLSGWVRNTGGGVQIEAEGDAGELSSFRTAIEAEAPPLAVISALRVRQIPLKFDDAFLILDSVGETSGTGIAVDCHVCDQCLAELFDPHDRRYLYPFINCTNCGPRYSIITGVPYDRHATTMASFVMCEECLAEYRDPLSRRFHAQPTGCHLCGPRLRLIDRSGNFVSGDPLAAAVEALARGAIVAVKGVGGFHLAVDALSDEAVGRLRARKRRDHKPFALLLAELDGVREIARCSADEGRLLQGPERPIVLLDKVSGNRVSRLVAPQVGTFGVMLPANALQHLLARRAGRPLVMTSGNISGDPILYRDAEVFEKLSPVADLFLTHDREIETGLDDSVLRAAQGSVVPLRRSRGYVPRAVRLPAHQVSVLGVGGELKAAVCVTRDGQGFMSQHIGDLNNAATLRAFQENTDRLKRLLSIEPQVVAHDLHPDYQSTRYAESLGLPLVGVQHHHAHMASCMAENGLEGEVIGVIFDGAGLGLDGAIWGGEFLTGGYGGFKRCGHFKYLRMPGGDAAVREPYRMALSALHELYGDRLLEQPLPVVAGVSSGEGTLLMKMLQRGINSPYTSSCGRLFDAVAALIGVRAKITYEGQAAMELEALAAGASARPPYPFEIAGSDCHTVDFAPMFAAICSDLARGRDRAEIARAFHVTVATTVVEMCRRIRQESGERTVVLSGGVFQNALLSGMVTSLLREASFEVYRHHLVPPNDGGLALGQAVIAGRRQKQD